MQLWHVIFFEVKSKQSACSFPFTYALIVITPWFHRACTLHLGSGLMALTGQAALVMLDSGPLTCWQLTYPQNFGDGSKYVKIWYSIIVDIITIWYNYRWWIFNTHRPSVLTHPQMFIGLHGSPSQLSEAPSWAGTDEDAPMQRKIRRYILGCIIRCNPLAIQRIAIETDP